MIIGSRHIGPGHSPYIIAELGVNHDGSVERALELTRAAHAAGADAVKLQLFRADLLMSRAARLAAYQHASGEHDPIDMLRRLELSTDQMAPIVRLAHQLGLHAIVTVFSVELVEESRSLPWDAYKSASPDIINRPLLDAVAAAAKPLIVSTGASDAEEIRRAGRWLDPVRDRLAFLHCVSAYPTPDRDANVAMIADVRRLAAGTPVGYSDHTVGVAAALAALDLDACLFEKHLTHDRSAPGPDHAASLDPAGFAGYANLLRAPTDRPAPDPVVMGAERRHVLSCERDVRAVSRQSLTTTRALPRAHVLTRADITIKRPGTGIPPFDIEATIGRPLARDVEADMPLMPQDLGGTP